MVLSLSRSPAIRQTFAGAVAEVVRETSQRPLILISHNPEVITAGLDKAGGKGTMIYGANSDNWQQMAGSGQRAQWALHWP